MEYKHYPVMLFETVDYLNVRKGGIYVDCTLGGGGHTREILKRLGGEGKLIAVDLDEYAINNAKTVFADAKNLTLVHGGFGQLSELLDENGIAKIDGAVIDLGVSSYQLDTPERGFSYMNDAPLDMRMNSSQKLDASEVVNGYDEQELTKIFFEYGEERCARKIAAAILANRAKKPIETTLELAEIIKSAVPKHEKGGHPAKRSFQAIRIEVNNELGQIKPALSAIVDRLNTGGRIAAISFHSLEDRIVKTTFADFASGCNCPKDFPVCVCGRKPIIKILTKKPLLPSENELAENARSHSAKLRAAEKL